MVSFAPPSLGQGFRARQVFVSPPRSRELTYSSDGDTNGVYYFIGTQFGAQTWANPYPTYVNGLTNPSNGVTVGAFSDRITTGEFGTTNTANAYCAVDLGSGRTLQLLKYSVRNRNSDGTRAIRNFKLQGTNNVATWDATGVGAATWADLDVRTADTSMPTTGASWGTYTLATIPLYYRYLRLLQTGVNALGDNFLILTELEFYGRLRY